MQLWNSQNTPKNASESVSYLPEIRFRLRPPGPPTRALPWTHWGPRRPQTPRLLCFHIVREQPFDFYGGGQEDFAKKNFRLWFQVKKILRLTLGSAFALRSLFSHSKIGLSQSEICFNYIIYFGNDFSHHKKEVFCSLKEVKKFLVNLRTWMMPPPPFNEMNCGRF